MQLDAPTLGVFIAAPLVILFVYIMLRARSGHLAKKLEPISAAFGGKLVKDFPRSYVRINRSGIEYSIAIWGDRETPQRHNILEIKVKVPFAFKSEVHEKTKIHETIENIGFFKDIKTGESAFDNKFLVRSNDPLKTKQFLEDDRRREAIKNLCGKKYTLTTGKKFLTLRKGSYKDEDIEPENIRFIMREIDKLS